MMLVKLVGNQCSEHWPIIRRSMQEALPPTGDWVPEEFLAKLLSDEMQAWISYDDEGTVEAIMTTTIVKDVGRKNGDLLVYTLTSFKDEHISQKSYVEGIETLKRYAKGLGLSNIITYSRFPVVWAEMRELGANDEWKILKWEV